MINEQIRVEYLAPERWNHLKEILDCIMPAPRILYALEGMHAAYAADGRSVPLPREGIYDAGMLPPDFDALQIWPVEETEKWYDTMHAACEPDTSIEEYLRMLRHDLPCRRYARARQPGRTMEDLTQAPEADCARACLVMRDGKFYFDVILVWRAEKLVLLSSLDRYDLPSLTVGPWDLPAIRDRIETEFDLPTQVQVVEFDALR